MTTKSAEGMICNIQQMLALRQHLTAIQTCRSRLAGDGLAGAASFPELMRHR
jgi:hypothetical protein